MLLESHGRVVTREEIQQRLWPGDAIVEFDHSINAAVRRLRDVLQDSAGKPRYIETVTRRGYRFIGQVDSAEEPERLATSATVVPTNGPVDGTAASVPTLSFPHRIKPLALILFATATILLAVWIGAKYN